MEKALNVDIRQFYREILGSIPKNCWISWRRYPRR